MVNNFIVEGIMREFRTTSEELKQGSIRIEYQDDCFLSCGLIGNNYDKVKEKFKKMKKIRIVGHFYKSVLIADFIEIE